MFPKAVLIESLQVGQIDQLSQNGPNFAYFVIFVKNCSVTFLVIASYEATQ